jgi:hypothetical protein
LQATQQAGVPDAALQVPVQTFLRARGIVVDATTVIQQAAVTALADNNGEPTSAYIPTDVNMLMSCKMATSTVLCNFDH